MPYPEVFMQELKARSEISDVVSGYVTLKRRGKNLIGLCPFHNEKTPSFNVNPAGGYFHCFGCGVGGDVITFIEMIENLDYPEAVALLAQRAGLNVPDDEHVDNSYAELKNRVREINRETARFYHRVLFSPEGKRGLDYFASRGLSLATIRHFGLGFSPDSSSYQLVNHLREMKFSDSDMIAANVANKSRNGNTYDRFRGRVMFPIIDISGNVVAFGGRALGDEKPKYINTSDTPVYKKSRGLFAMNFAKNTSSGRLILAEGYMDVISLHAAGFTEAIASLGTALTQEQAGIISRYAKEVVICYDSDEAGRKAAQRAIPILRATGINVRVMNVPGNKDPDEFLKSGPDAAAKFRALVEGSGNDVEYRLKSIRDGYDTGTADGAVRYLTEACTVLAGIENDIERNVYAGKLSEELNVDKSAILHQTEKVRTQLRRSVRKKNEQEQRRDLTGLNDTVNREKRLNVRAANAEENIIRYLFRNPDGLKIVESRLTPEMFVTDFNRTVYEFIINRLKTGEAVTVGDMSGHFTHEEISAVVRILSREMAQVSDDDILSSIDILSGGGYNASADEIRGFSTDDFASYFKALRNRKK